MSHIFGILPKDLGITFTQLLMAKLKYLYIEHLRNISTCISPCPIDYEFYSSERPCFCLFACQFP